MSAIIRFKRGNSANWTSNGNIILSSGEPGYEIDTGRTKIGDGVTPWNDLYYSSIVPTGFISGSGIRLDIAENGSSATISISGLISNPANNRILTSRDNTTTGIDAETNLVFDGSRLGVNTSNPSGALHIIGSGIIASTTGTRPNALLSLYSSVSGDTLFNVFSNNGNLFSITNNVTGSLLSVNDSLGLSVFQVSTDPSISGGRFLKNDLVLTSGGNLGLGTNNPLYKLHVDGSGFFRSGLYISGLVVSNTGILDRLVFNTGLDDPDLLSGQLQWNTTEGTLDLGLNDNYTMHLGEEMLYRIKNTTGATLRAGQPVYASGLSSGSNNRIEVNLYAANGDIREIRFMGLMTVDCPDNGNSGYATHFGYIRGVDTNGGITEDYSSKLWVSGEPDWLQGDILYVHPSVPGKLTKIEPKHSISVAIITSKGNNGKLFVRPTSYGHLNDNHDVEISGVTNGQFLQYNSSTDYWVPSSSGNFSTLLVNGTGVSISGHTHTSSDITDFSSSVSGLLPTVANSGDNRLITSVGTTTGLNAESNATFDGTTLSVTGDITVDNLRFDGNTLSSTNNNGNIIINPNGTGALQRDSGGNARGQYAVDWQTVRSTGTMVAGGNYSIIGGGRNNTSSGSDSTVGGGRYNTSNGNYSTVCGGYSNTSSGFYSTVGGGQSNTSNGPYSTVGGGAFNTSSGITSTIGGGRSNKSIGEASTVGGGRDNESVGNYSTVAGGRFCDSTNLYSTIGGGVSNKSMGFSSTVCGGDNNTASGNYSAILGGQHNNDNGHNNVFILGSNISATQPNTTFVENLDVAISGDIGTLKIDNFYHQNLAVATGIADNDLLIAIVDPTGSPTTEVIQGSVLRSSLLNQPAQLQFRQGTDAERLLITPASGEPIWTTDTQKFYIGDGTTVGGDFVGPSPYDRSFGTQSISALNIGCVASGNYSVVCGGTNNTSSGSYSTVGGGSSNNSNGFVSTVGGGYNNSSSNNHSTVGGGGGNLATGISSTIAGGGGDNAINTLFGTNTASALATTIGGGIGNYATGDVSTIPGGFQAKASRHGELSHSAGIFSQTGDAQHTILIARRTTTNNTANQVLFLNGSNQRLVLPAETTWAFSVKLSAYNDTDNEGGWWIFRGGIRRNAANGTALIGSLITESGTESSLSTASASVVADDTNEALEIRVTGVTGKNIRWVAVVDISQVSYGTP